RSRDAPTWGGEDDADLGEDDRDRRELSRGMRTRSGSAKPSLRADVPTTLLLGRRWATVCRSIRHLARRMAAQLGHDVERCDLAAPAGQLRAIAARGVTQLVLLPVTLDDSASRRARVAERMTTALGACPSLRIAWGEPPAIDDVARMLGDRARA